MEYYSVIKKNEIMAFAATWMDPDIVILSAGSQTETNGYNSLRYTIYPSCLSIFTQYFLSLNRIPLICPSPFPLFGKLVGFV